MAIERHEITSSDEWLEWRKADVSASHVAAVLGQDQDARADFFKEVAPEVRRVAFLHHPRDRMNEFLLHPLTAACGNFLRCRQRQPMSEAGGRTDSTRTCRHSDIGAGLRRRYASSIMGPLNPSWPWR
jgi:hypothetical protein